MCLSAASVNVWKTLLECCGPVLMRMLLAGREVHSSIDSCWAIIAAERVPLLRMDLARITVFCLGSTTPVKPTLSPRSIAFLVFSRQISSAIIIKRKSIGQSPVFSQESCTKSWVIAVYLQTTRINLNWTASTETRIYVKISLECFPVVRSALISWDAAWR